MDSIVWPHRGPSKLSGCQLQLDFLRNPDLCIPGPDLFLCLDCKTQHLIMQFLLQDTNPSSEEIHCAFGQHFCDQTRGYELTGRVSCRESLVKVSSLAVDRLASPKGNCTDLMAWICNCDPELLMARRRVADSSRSSRSKEARKR